MVTMLNDARSKIYASPAPLLRSSVEEMSLLKSRSGMLSKSPCIITNVNDLVHAPCSCHS